MPLKMQPEEQHRIKADRNQFFADSLDKSDETRESWAVTAAFYSALHYVEQFFVKYGSPCANHEQRNEQFKGDVRINKAYTNYHFLSDLSHDARYKCKSLPKQAFEKLAKPQLDAVKKQIDHALELAGGGATPPTSPRRIDKLLPAEPPRPMPGKPR